MRTPWIRFIGGFLPRVGPFETSDQVIYHTLPDATWTSGDGPTGSTKASPNKYNNLTITGTNNMTDGRAFIWCNNLIFSNAAVLSANASDGEQGGVSNAGDGGNGGGSGGGGGGEATMDGGNGGSGTDGDDGDGSGGVGGAGYATTYLSGDSFSYGSGGNGGNGIGSVSASTSGGSSGAGGQGFGGGGGAGGGGTLAIGPGAGGAGGLICIVCREVTPLGASAFLRARGGNGGSCAEIESGSPPISFFDGGGGGGGGGGVVYLATKKYTGFLSTNITRGVGGSGEVSSASNGTSGTARIFEISQDETTLTLRTFANSWDNL